MSTETKQATVTVTMSIKQAEILVRALDLYARIGIGQIGEVKAVWKRFYETFVSNPHILDKDLNTFKYALTGMQPGESHGIGAPGKVAEEFNIAYEMRSQVQHDLAWFKEPEGNGAFCRFDKPLKLTKEPLPTVQITK